MQGPDARLCPKPLVLYPKRTLLSTQRLHQLRAENIDADNTFCIPSRMRGLVAAVCCSSALHLPFCYKPELTWARSRNTVLCNVLLIGTPFTCKPLA